MSSIKSLIVRHRALAAVTGIVALGLVVFVLVWFQPQKLFLDQRVSEALPGEPVGSVTPGATAAEPAAAAMEEPASQLTTLASGRFRTLEHDTTGRVVILQEADGARYLRFENLQTSNGPDLHVYLSEIPASDDWYAYGERFVDLGKLKGNIGDQNYEIPHGVDLSKYRSAVIWCKRFSVGFGVAPLEP